MRFIDELETQTTILFPVAAPEYCQAHRSCFSLEKSSSCCFNYEEAGRLKQVKFLGWNFSRVFFFFFAIKLCWNMTSGPCLFLAFTTFGHGVPLVSLLHTFWDMVSFFTLSHLFCAFRGSTKFLVCCSFINIVMYGSIYILMNLPSF